MAEAGGVDLSGLPAWAQTAAAVGIVIASFLVAMRGKWSGATLADQPKTHADEVVERQAAEQLEILKAIRDAVTTSRDAALASRDTAALTERSITAMREQGNRVVTCQEAIVEMMKKAADDEVNDLKLEVQSLRQLKRLAEVERELDDERRRPSHRD